MQFAVLILTKSPVSSALPCQQKKNPVITRERGLTGFLMFFIYCLPPSLVSAFYSFLSAGYVHAPWQSVERLVHACALCAPAHQSAVKRVHVHVCLLAGIVGGYCPYAGRVLVGHVVDSVLAVRHRG